MRKNLRKVLSVALCSNILLLTLLFSRNCVQVLAATTMSGLGTATNPYIVITAANLASINGSSACYQLGNNIDMTSTTWASVSGFSGTLNGAGHSIMGLNYTFSDDTVTGSSGLMYKGGLVDYNSGIIENLSVSASLNMTAYGRLSVYDGGLVGCNTGTITNCTTSGTLISSYGAGGLVGRNQGDINHSYSYMSISGDSYCGGAVGDNDGQISYTKSAGNVIGSMYIGGFVGEDEESISYCGESGTVSGHSDCGGFVGMQYASSYGTASISYSYSSGVTTGTALNVSNIGGFCGYMTGSANYMAISEFCYSTGNVLSEGQFDGGFVGLAYLNSCIGCCYATGNVTGVAGTVAFNGYTNTIGSDVGGFVGYGLSSVSVAGAIIYASYSTGIEHSNDTCTGSFAGYYSGGYVTTAGRAGYNFSNAAGAASGNPVDNSWGATRTLASMQTAVFASSLNTAGVATGVTSLNNEWMYIAGINSSLPVLYGVGVGADTVAPTLTFSPVSGYATNKAFSVYAIISDSFSGVGAYNYAISSSAGTVLSGTVVVSTTVGSTTSSMVAIPISVNGTNTISMTVTDVAGNSYTASASYCIDTVPPVATITISPLSPSGNNGWYNHSSIPTVTFHATDTGSGIASITYSVAGTVNQTNISIQDGGVYALPKSGTYTITEIAVDAAGNTTTVSNSVNWDNDLPIVTATIIPTVPSGANGWYNGINPPTAIFSGSDATSDLSSISYSATSAGVTATGTLSNGGVYTLPHNGNYSIIATATDNAGNSNATNSSALKWDSIAPVSLITVSGADIGDNGWYKGSTAPVVTFTGSDATSGISTMQYSVDGASSASAISVSNNATYTLPRPGVYIITLVTTDNAGNQSSIYSIVKWDYNSTALSIATNPTSPNGDNGWFKGSAAPSTIFSISDYISGISGANYTVSGSITVGNTLTADGSSYVLPASGLYTVGLSGVNNAGDITTADLPIKWDSTGPIITESASGGTGVTGVVINGSATDELSGLKSLMYSYSDNQGVSWTSPEIFTSGDTYFADTGNYLLELDATDLAGNVTTKQLNINISTPTFTSLVNTTSSSQSYATIQAITNDVGGGIKYVAYTTGKYTDTTDFSNANPTILTSIAEPIANNVITSTANIESNGWYTFMAVSYYGQYTFDTIHVTNIYLPPAIVLGNTASNGSSMIGFDAMNYSCNGLYDPSSKLYYAYGSANPTIYDDGNINFDYAKARLDTTGILIQLSIKGANDGSIGSAFVDYNGAQYPVCWGSLTGSTKYTNNGSKFYGYGYIDCSNFTEGAGQQLSLTVNESSLEDGTLLYSTTVNLGNPVTIDLSAPSGAVNVTALGSNITLSGIVDNLTAPLELDYRYGSGSDISSVTSWSQWVTSPILSGNSMLPLSVSDGNYVLEYRTRDILRNQSETFGYPLVISGSSSSSATVRALFEDGPSAQIYYFGSDQTANTTLPLTGFQLS